MKIALSRRDAFKALAVASPALAAQPAAAQESGDSELQAAERRLAASIQILREFKLPLGAEPAAIFKA